MWEDMFGVPEASETLQGAPDGWQSGEEAEDEGAGGAASDRILPGADVKAEEELGVLEIC